MDYMSTDFGAGSLSRFPFRARTNRQTRLNATPTPATTLPAWVNTYTCILKLNKLYKWRDRQQARAIYEEFSRTFVFIYVYTKFACMFIHFLSFSPFPFSATAPSCRFLFLPDFICFSTSSCPFLVLSFPPLFETADKTRQASFRLILNCIVFSQNALHRVFVCLID